MDSGLTYTTRVFRAPEGAAGVFPVVSLYADHRVAKPARNGLVVPIEGDRWMVSLSGSRGARPPADAAGFAAFARSLRHPLVARMVAAAEPLTEPRSTRSTRNRRLRYERMPSWPAGLLVLGDALSALNPAYGHGMTAAARGAEALRDELAAHGVRPERARETVGAISAAVDDPWLWATSQDVRFPECRIVSRDAELGSRAEARARFADLLQAAASRDAGVNVAMAGVMSMSEPLAGLEDAGVLDAVRAAAASGAKPLPQPRLSGAELALLRGRRGSPSADGRVGRWATVWVVRPRVAQREGAPGVVTDARGTSSLSSSVSDGVAEPAAQCGLQAVVSCVGCRGPGDEAVRAYEQRRGVDGVGRAPGHAVEVTPAAGGVGQCGGAVGEVDQHAAAGAECFGDGGGLSVRVLHELVRHGPAEEGWVSSFSAPSRA